MTPLDDLLAESYDAIDLFAGPGGWDVAARSLDLRVLGIEWDHAACETRRAAGLPTIEGDVREYGPDHFPGIRGFIASPPCQTFSMAGKGSGRAALDTVLALIKAMEAREPLDLSTLDDERTGLVLEPLRWALAAVDAGRPFEWLAFEQVPTVLPVWEAMAEVLRREGYSAAVGKLSSEQYGVPQTRKRAILVARLDGEAALPAPTHRSYRKGVPQTDGDPSLLPWVSMAEALGWGATERPGMTVTGGGTATGGAEPFGNAARQALAAERDAGRWVVAAGVTGEGTPRPHSHPSPSVTGKGTAYWIDNPNVWQRGGVRPDTGSTRVTTEEAALLQSFPADHPWQGNKGKVFQQIGNAVPPLLARAVLAAVAGVEVPAPEPRPFG